MLTLKNERTIWMVHDSAHNFIKLVDALQWTWDDTPESVAYAKPHVLYFTNKLKDLQGSYDCDQCLP